MVTPSIQEWAPFSEKPCDADQLNQRNPKGVVNSSTIPVASERCERAVCIVGWSGCQSRGLLSAAVVWSKVTVLPASICCCDETVATTLPSLSTMSVFSVAVTAAVRLFCTSVLISTVLEEPAFVARVGVVTQVPYQAMRSGSATTTNTSRYTPRWNV